MAFGNSYNPENITFLFLGNNISELLDTYFISRHSELIVCGR